MNKKLAIIGGMGAFAGLRLAQYLLKRVQDSKIMADYDYPEFLLYNLPVRGMDEKGITNPELVKSQLKESLSKIEAWGCGQVIIACNSAHMFFDELQSVYSGKIINMIESACHRVRVQRVGILCSDTTRTQRLYESTLERNGISTISSTDEEQDWLNDAVRAAISGRSIRGNLTDVERIVIRMTRSGADQIIIGCTEIPLILDSDISADFIDAGQEAINQAIKNG